MTKTPMEPLFLSDREAAELLGLSRNSFYKAREAGDLPPAARIGGRTLNDRDALVAHVRDLARRQAA